MGFFRRFRHAAANVTPVSQAACNIVELLTEAPELWEQVKGTTFDLNIALTQHKIVIRDYIRGANGQSIDVLVGDDQLILTDEDRRAIDAAARAWESHDRNERRIAAARAAREAKNRTDQHLAKVMWDVFG